MALKNAVNSLDDVDEKFHSFYTEKKEGGQHHLDKELRQPDGDSELLEKIAGFRDLNIDLTGRLAALEKDRDDAQAKADAATSEATKVSTENQTMIERVASLEAANASAVAETAAATQTARMAQLSDTLGKLGAAQGVKQSALGTFSQVHSANFGFDDEGVAYVKGDGDRPKLSVINAGQRMTSEEYVTSTLQKEDFWLEPSSGDGAGGDGGGVGGSTKTITRSEAENNWSTHEKGIADGSVIVQG